MTPERFMIEVIRLYEKMPEDEPTAEVDDLPYNAARIALLTVGLLIDSGNYPAMARFCKLVSEFGDKEGL